MKDKIDINSLIKFTKGKYSYNDYLNVKEWFANENEPQKVKDELLNHWEEINDQYKGNDLSLKHIFDKIHYNILQEESRQVKRKTLWTYYRQIAAIFLIPVLAFGLWYFLTLNSGINNPFNQQIALGTVEVNAPIGSRVEFLLPDSSSVWLNSGSSLKYSPFFNKNRKVELVGEAWFDVKHYDQSEFIVSVVDMDVKVLGTQFNVSAYIDDEYTEVTLEEGKVEVYGKTGVFSQVLAPDEKISFNKENRSLTLNEVTAERFSAWREGYLIIDNEPLENVVSRLERWYNIDIVIRDDVLKAYRFKATFKNEPIEEVLKLMAQTTPILYTIHERTKNSNGTYNQKKVTMKLKK